MDTWNNANVYVYLLTLDEIHCGSLRETSELDDHKAENWSHPHPQEDKLALLATGTAMTKSDLETLANSDTSVNEGCQGVGPFNQNIFTSMLLLGC